MEHTPVDQPECILIVGGRVIDPVCGTDAVLDVAIADGEICEIGAGLSRVGFGRVIEADGCLVTAGWIDPHVHLREPGQTHKEDIASGTRAAVAGGFTTVCCMPNTAPALDSPEMVGFVRMRAEQTGVCRVFPVAAATVGRKGERLAEIGLCARGGAVGFSDDGDVIASAGMMHAVLRAVEPTGRVFMQHAQEPTLTRGASMHAGDVSTRLGLTGWPRVAEELIAERDVRLVGATGCRYHIQHVSSGGTVEIIRRARAGGLPVTGEASPHHLTLTHEACDGYDTSAKMNPPLREQADIDALVEGVADGTITVLATDHAPHSAGEKALPFEEAAFGIVGLETAAAIYAEVLVRSGAIGWGRLVELLTVEPARLCGLDAMGLGRLAVGGIADVTVFDPDAQWVVCEEDLKGKSRNTPFVGRSVRGRVRATVVGGCVRFVRVNDAALV